MRYALSADAMRAVEHAEVASGAATVGELMERAGAAVVAELERRVPTGRVVVVCGPGNNGGDGWVVARRLVETGRAVQVIASADFPSRSGEAGEAAAGALRAGVELVDTADADAIVSALSHADIVVDAIFGFGFRGPARSPYVDAIDRMNVRQAPIIAIDVPSGVDSDTGAIDGLAVCASVTVTFTAEKPGLMIYPGASHAGEVVLADLGIALPPMPGPGWLAVPSPADIAALIPVPGLWDHKGSRGTVGIVAGSAAYAGAAVLAASGALRLGAGYVRLVVPDAIGDVVRCQLPNVIVAAVMSTGDGAIADPGGALTALAGVDVVVAGPGLTDSDASEALVRALVGEVAAPLLLDADALNALVRDRSMLDSRSGPVVLTPHPGEAARLLGVTSAEVQRDRVTSALRLAGTRRTCLLKGARSIVADGERASLVLAGSPALARAGSGDVLAGMIGTLLAQGVAPADAALVGAHLHGRAGELGAAALTATCFTATDIVAFLPEAVRELAAG